MNYHIYRMEFPKGVHIGKTSLDTGQGYFCADTLFSALCIEALKYGPEEMDGLVEETRAGNILISDAFPYIGKTFYVPRPHMPVENGDGALQTDKKSMKNLTYIPSEDFSLYLKGGLDAGQTLRKLQGMGAFTSRTSAAIRGNDETLPYRVGIYNFAQGCGLYIIAGCANAENAEILENLLDSLSYSGIGGKRSEGLGQFVLYREKIIPAGIAERLGKDSRKYMSLSVGLPKEGELEAVMKDAGYKIIKRSGFVSSATYSQSFQRKKNLFVFSAGSCFADRFEGDVYDVAGYGAHPVYRYAKPVFMGVDL